MDLAALEGEVLLLGVWRNVEELEDSLSLPELRTIIEAAREQERRQNTFLAALQGIDLNKHVRREQEEAFDRVQRRVQSKLSGRSTAELEHDDFGFGFEIEE